MYCLTYCIQILLGILYCKQYCTYSSSQVVCSCCFDHPKLKDCKRFACTVLLCDELFSSGAMRNDNGDLERPNGESYPIDTIGFWGKGQPKDKRDYKCVLVDAKKGKKKGKGKHHHGQGSSPSLEWELKKCKDKKPYLCELKCEAGKKAKLQYKLASSWLRLHCLLILQHFAEPRTRESDPETLHKSQSQH